MFQTALLNALRNDLKNLPATAKYTANGTTYDAGEVSASVAANGNVLVSASVSALHGTVTNIKLYDTSDNLLVLHDVNIEAGSADSIVYRFTFTLQEVTE